MRGMIVSGLAVASLGLATASSAADLALGLRPQPQPVPIAYNWTGFYVGANGGYSSGSGGVRGAIGGGQLGYNWQAGSFVFGLETDLQASGQKGSTTASALGVTLSETEKLSWLGTTRVRAGVAADRWFFYGTAGAAYGEIKINGAATGLLTGPYSASNTKVGWTAGAGVEAALSEHWSARVEYLYASFSGFSNTYALTGATITVAYPRINDNIIRAGLNYRF